VAAICRLKIPCQRVHVGAERALVSETITAGVFFLVALWSPKDMYIFTDPQFENRAQCVEYVLVAHMDLNTHLAALYGGPVKMNHFYCVDGEKLKDELDKKDSPQV